MSNNELGETNHIDAEANNNSEQRDGFSVCFLRILLISLILASVSLDPLFFYISVIDNDSNCLQSDNVLRSIVVVLRTFADGAYLTLWWCLMLGSRSSRHGPRERTCFGVRIPQTIYFLIVDVLAFLPLPQGVVVCAVSWRLLTVKLLKFIVLIQIVPKVYLTLSTYNYAKQCLHGIIHKTFAAAFYFLMFILAGDVLGAFWYLRAIERNMDCWHKACKIRGLCGASSLYCDGNLSDNKYLDKFCPIRPSNSTFFDYGIYFDAFQRDIMGMHTNFINKIYYCTWWGLSSLSSFGQNLNPGTYIWDNIFSTFIVISGLLLFSLLIGNMQVHLRKKASSDADKKEREEQSRKEMKLMMERMEKENQEIIKRMEKEKQERMARMEKALHIWCPFLSLPLPLRNAIASCEDENWLGTTNVNFQSLLKNIPFSIRKDVRLHFSKEMFSKVEKFEKLDQTIKQELRERAKPVVFQERSIIHAEGYPIHEMIHIVHGKALAFNKDSTRKEGSLQLRKYILEGNDPIGKELLDWSLESPQPFLPLATETVMAVTTVEAFTLSFDDFAFVFTCHGRSINKAYEEEWAKRVLMSEEKWCEKA